MANKLSKDLKGKKELNPYNSLYKSSNIDDRIREKKYTNADEAYEIAQASKIFNKYYKEYEKYIDFEVNDLTSQSFESIIQGLISVSNRNLINIQKKLKLVKYDNLTELSQQSIKSRVEELGDLNLISALEDQVDIINILLNRLKYNFDKGKTQTLTYDVIDSIGNMFAFTNIHYYMKESYDAALWDNGYIEQSSNRLHIRYKDEELLKLRSIGQIRAQENIFGTIVELEGFIKDLIVRSNSLSTEFKPRVLHNVLIRDNGYLDFRVRKTNAASLNDAIVIAFANITLYYPYVYESSFEQIGNLKILDVVNIMCKVSELAEAYVKTLHELPENPDISAYNVKISEEKIVQYIKMFFSYQKSAILRVLNLCSTDFNMEERGNLWNSPLIKIGRNYQIACSSILAPNYTHLIDHWLNELGYNLSDRGHNFERYVKNKLSGSFTKQNFQLEIDERKKYTINQDDFEEIDLVIEGYGKLIVAEVKCINYPLEKRDYHNARKILSKASKQVKRKSEFLQKHSNHFFDKQYKCTDVIELVITNYPNLSGMKIDGINIIDFYLFDSYFACGSYRNTKFEFVNDKTISNSIEHKYYENDVMAMSTLSEFLNKPPTIYNKLENYVVSKQRINITGDFEIYQDFISDSV